MGLGHHCLGWLHLCLCFLHSCLGRVLCYGRLFQNPQVSYLGQVRTSHSLLCLCCLRLLQKNRSWSSCLCSVVYLLHLLEMILDHMDRLVNLGSGCFPCHLHLDFHSCCRSCLESNHRLYQILHLESFYHLLHHHLHRGLCVYHAFGRCHLC